MTLRTKGIVLCLFIFCASLNLSACYPEFLPRGIVLQGFNGSTLNTSDIKNEMVVFQFFSLKCLSCKHDMEIVGKLSQEKKVRYIPVSVDRTLATARLFFQISGPEIRIYEPQAHFDQSKKFAKKIGVREKAIVVVNVKGEIVAASADAVSQNDVKILEDVLQSPNFPNK